jgi:hypothetical protein
MCVSTQSLTCTYIYIYIVLFSCLCFGYDNEALEDVKVYLVFVIIALSAFNSLSHTKMIVASMRMLEWKGNARYGFCHDDGQGSSS